MGATSLRLMSVNLENLFSPGVNFYGKSYSPVEYQEKVVWLAQLIASCQVHVVALIELGDRADECLSDLCNTIKQYDPTGYPDFQYYHSGEPCQSPPKIRTAIISRFPISNQGSITTFCDGFNINLFDPEDKKWKDVPISSYSRPVAYATITPPNGASPFNLFVVHFKSKRSCTAAHDEYNEPIGVARSAIRRNVEAAALRFYLDQFLPAQYELNKKIGTFVVGDFNDTPTSVPVENIRGPFDTNPGPAKPWSEPDKRRLLNCARLHLKLSAYNDKLFSYVHNEQFTLIDHIFATEHFAKKFVRMEIYNDHVFRHKQLSTATDVESKWKSKVSDHGALVAEFKKMLRS